MITSRSVQVGVVFLSLIVFNCISLFPGDRTAVARYLCNKYPTRFQKLNSAQVYVTRVMKRAEDAVENGVGAGTPNLMADRRSIGSKRAKPVMDNLEVQRVIERICSIHNGNIKNTWQECQRLGLKASHESLRKMAKILGFHWQKPWHTDVLTTAQKYKRTLFCKKLLRCSKENLLRLLSVWLFTDEKWFDIVGPSPGQWVRAATKARCKMENQVIDS